ncbi:MAG TPA: class I SAM-dependent methyltransferase [Casimicrobiaceae bacterium]|nr:class I SAM-dependent methyltransferase [Casimicrobiaceae bacterium]
MRNGTLSSYDQVPYASRPLPQTHPGHLATVGALFGFDAPDVARCRVLEIGCAAGGNLIPLAASHPDSTFVGIDSSPVQVAQGAGEIAALGLANIRLLPIDLMDFFGDEHGEFDYVIAHGIYSWVPAPVQQAILELCGRRLAKNGIALVSYNTLPGWRLLSVVREAMLYQAKDIADPRARVAQARATLDFLAESVPDRDSAYGRLLRLASEHIRRKPDYYVLHEYLEATNEALYFEQFIARIAPHALRYLGDSDVTTMLAAGLPQNVVATLDRIAPDLVRREQFLDFLSSRSFRHSLLVREGAALERKLTPARIVALRIAAPVALGGLPADTTSDRTHTFRLIDGRKVDASPPIVKSVLAVLAERWPLPSAFDELFERAMARLGGAARDAHADRALLAAELLRLYAAGALELHREAPRFVLTPGQQPEAFAPARRDAQRGPGANVSANLRHEPIALDDEERALLPLLDGERGRDDIAALRWPALSEAERVTKLDHALVALGRRALLVR